MARQSKKDKAQSTIEDDAAVASSTDNTQLNQEVRLAEAQPGDIEALEQALDSLQEDHSILLSSYDALANDSVIREETNLMQEELIRRQIAEITHNKSTIASLEDALDRASDMIETLMNKVTAQAAQVSHSIGSSMSRKDQILGLMLPDGPDSCPGPKVTITQLAQLLNTNNKNVSSILTPLRDLGYAIMTDELGRKYIKSYDPAASYKNGRTSVETAPASMTITPDELVATVVKRTADGLKRIS